MASPKGFILYRIWYGKHLAYLGRTKQPLQARIRGHMFARPMHRAIDIHNVRSIASNTSNRHSSERWGGMKDVFIVLVIINDTVEVDSVFWNEKKAHKRWNEIMDFSDGTAYVLKKWVNPKIVLSAKEYTQKRATKLKMPQFFPLIDNTGK